MSLSWAVAVDLTPASARPYVGSSGDNSALNLALGYNGAERLLGGSGTPGGGNSSSGVNLFNGGPAGVFRLIGTTLGGQVGWLLALAVLGLAVAAVCVPWRRMDTRTRSLILWGTWLLVTGAFFSVAGFFHPYYTVMLAPAIAALAAIGVTVLWRSYCNRERRGWLLPVVLLASAGVEAYILRDYPDWSRWLTPLVAGSCLVAALVLVVARLRLRRPARAALVAVGLATMALLTPPTTWAAYSVLSGTTNSSIPTAGPSAQSSTAQGGFGGAGGPGSFAGSGAGRPSGSPPSGAPQAFGQAGSGNGSSAAGSTTGSAVAGGSAHTGAAGGFGGSQTSTALIRYLEAHQGSARYLVATASSNEASSIIITTGKAVMALGGFSGNDSILTTSQLAKLVAGGSVHYFLVQSGGMNNSSLMQWVEAHGTVVSPSQYGASSSAQGAGGGQATSLYFVSSSAAQK